MEEEKINEIETSNIIFDNESPNEKKGEIIINPKDIGGKIKSGFNFLKQKKVINIIFAILFLIILILGVSIRVQNLDLLKDPTTGENIPLALDPFYFLRLAETIVEQGSLPEYDNMRYPSLKVAFNQEIMPQAVIFLWKIGKIFDGDVTLRFINVLSPVIFFALALIAFFFLIFFLTRSRTIALISSAFLAFHPAFLYRTLSGFSDHEAIGIFAFFVAMLAYSLFSIIKKDCFRLFKREIYSFSLNCF